MALPDSVREVDRRPGGPAGRPAPDASCRSPRSSAGTSTSTCWPGPPTTAEDELLDILEAAAAVAPGPGARRRARAATPSPTPSSSTPCTRTWVPPVGPGPTGRWPRRWRTSAAAAPGPGWGSWPGTGCTPPSPSTWPGHRLLAPGRRRRADRTRPGRRPPPLRPGPRALRPDRRPRPGTRPRPGHRAGDGAAPDRGPGLPGHAARCGPPGRRARRHRPVGRGGPGQQPRVLQLGGRHRRRQGADTRGRARRPCRAPAASGRSSWPPCARSWRTGARSSAGSPWPGRRCPSPRRAGTTRPSCAC